MAGPSETLETNAAEATSSTEEGYSSNDFMKHINEILQGEEEEAVDASFVDDVEAEDHHRVVLEGSGHESFDSGVDGTDNKEEVHTESSSDSPKERSVKVTFSGMEGPSPPPDVDLDAISKSQLIRKLGGLQERLTQTQIDLKQEKSSRKKKDKNIFKMAQELSKRNAEATEKEEEIHRLTQLLGDMAAKLEKAKELEEEMRHTMHRYEMMLTDLAAKDALLEDMGTKLEKATESEKELRQTIGGYEKKWADLATKEAQRNSKPQLQIKQKSPLATPDKTEKPSASETKRSSRHRREIVIEPKRKRNGFSRTLVALCLLLAVFVTNLYLLSADGVCAPVFPSSVLAGRDFASEAPWWAPDSMKVPCFQFFCGGRRRIHVKVESGKLFLREERNGKMKTLHKAETVRTKINKDSIIVEDRRGSKTAISAPWVR